MVAGAVQLGDVFVRIAHHPPCPKAAQLFNAGLLADRCVSGWLRWQGSCCKYSRALACDKQYHTKAQQFPVIEEHYATCLEKVLTQRCTKRKEGGTALARYPGKTLRARDTQTIVCKPFHKNHNRSSWNHASVSEVVGRSCPRWRSVGTRAQEEDDLPPKLNAATQI
eukprot:1897188-Amphidinium_carterae.2